MRDVTVHTDAKTLAVLERKRQIEKRKQSQVQHKLEKMPQRPPQESIAGTMSMTRAPVVVLHPAAAPDRTASVETAQLRRARRYVQAAHAHVFTCTLNSKRNSGVIHVRRSLRLAQRKEAELMAKFQARQDRRDSVAASMSVCCLASSSAERVRFRHPRQGPCHETPNKAASLSAPFEAHCPATSASELHDCAAAQTSLSICPFGRHVDAN